MADDFLGVGGVHLENDEDTTGKAKALLLNRDGSLANPSNELTRHNITGSDWITAIGQQTLYVGEDINTTNSIRNIDVRRYKEKTFYIKNEFNAPIEFTIWTSRREVGGASDGRIFSINEPWERIEAGKSIILTPFDYRGLAVNQSYMFIQIRYASDYSELPNETGHIRIIVWGGN